MQIKGRKRTIIIIFLFFVVLLIDQLSKLLALNYLEFEKSINVFNSILFFTLIKNTGGIFGIFPGFNNLYIFLSITFLIFIIMFYKKIRNENLLFLSGFVIIIGSAIGNLLDRIRYGYVIDFIDVKIWPIFNFADVGIVCGCALIFWGLLK